MFSRNSQILLFVMQVKNLKVLIGDLDVNKLFLIKSSQQRKHENLCQFVDLGTGGLCTLYNYLKHDKKASK